MNASKTYYDILGVAADASQDAIRTAFRLAAKRYHPDHLLSYVQSVRATAKMQEINAAYALLRNRDSRRAYDETLAKRDVSVTEATAMPRGHRCFRMDSATAWIIVLRLNPRPSGVEKLSGSEEDFYRIRVGDYRILYAIQDKVLLVIIIKVRHRREVYRG